MRLRSVLIAGAAAVALGATAVPLAAQAPEATLELDVSTIPSNRDVFASGTCPNPSTENPLPGAEFSLSDGTVLDGTGIWDGEFDHFQLHIPLETEPGDYEVVVTCEGGAEASAPLTVTQGVERTLQVDDPTPYPGQVVVLTGTCNRPGEFVDLFLGQSASRTPSGDSLGATRTDDTGAFRAEVTIPADAYVLDPDYRPAGEWQLESRCLDYGGAVVPIEIVAAPVTPAATPVDAEPTFTG